MFTNQKLSLCQSCCCFHYQMYYGYHSILMNPNATMIQTRKNPNHESDQGMADNSADGTKMSQASSRVRHQLQHHSKTLLHYHQSQSPECMFQHPYWGTGTHTLKMCTHLNKTDKRHFTAIGQHAQ